jgi:hypothetical protein
MITKHSLNPQDAIAMAKLRLMHARVTPAGRVDHAGAHDCLSAWWTVDLTTARHRAKQSRLLYLAALDRLVRLGKSVGVSVFCPGSSS